MSIKRLADDLFIIPGLVNIYVLVTQDGLVLLDTGFPGSGPKIEKALKRIGKDMRDVSHIILTHAHPDHIGSAAAVKRASGAKVWAHPIDKAIIEAGSGFRPVIPSPGLRNRILARLLMGRVTAVEPTIVDDLLQDGGSAPFLPDLRAIHAPGHCAGQIAFLWARHGGVLFTADVGVNRGGITLPVAVENLDQARADMRRLAQEEFQMVCVMHGRPILDGGGAAFKSALAAF